MKIEFLQPAYVEFQEAVDYYNMQNESLGNKFIVEVERTLSIIQKYPDAFPQYTKHSKKAVVIAFPYNIIYSIHKEKIIVIAVAHQHRKPNYWLKRKH
ncbi:type II toxin-antitoxin system RelE/ParE family toxin [Melioribacteraceae bacterium 4301-Me]|uniref:type II toxin-antitoxin system RelE/ParE family toxin n=1 Tax=Pyranulibacter aquaticus TaxID=3163344 RepID=UPI003599773E